MFSTSAALYLSVALVSAIIFGFFIFLILSDGKKRINHLIKNAAILGCILGFIFSLTDIYSNIVYLRFAWHQIYQAILCSILINLAIAFTVAIVILILERCTGKNADIAYVNFFTAFSLIFAYLAALLLNFLKKHFHLLFGHRVLIFLCSVLFSFSVLIYFDVPRKAKKFFSIGRVNKITQAFAVFLALYVFFCLIFDIYLVNSVNLPAPKAGYGPNVILITLDTLRRDHLSLYGYKYNTSPNLDEFAKKSVVFKNAISVSSWTLPSHATLFTGLYPSRHLANWDKPLTDDARTLAEILHGQGYLTAGFAGGWFTDSRFGFSQGFDIYKDRKDFFDFCYTRSEYGFLDLINTHVFDFEKILFKGDCELSSSQLNNQIFGFLEKARENEPFFLFINYYDAHELYNLKSDRYYFTELPQIDESIELLNLSDPDRHLAEGTVDLLVKQYDNEIVFLDENLGKLIGQLDKEKLLNNSMVVILSDHGEEFYEHRGLSHAETLFGEVIQIPMLIYYPSRLQPMNESGVISSVDVFSTILGMLDMVPPANTQSENFFKAKNSYRRDFAYSELTKESNKKIYIQSVTSDRYKLILERNGTSSVSSMFFDLKNDPKESVNIYDDANEEAKETLHEMLAFWDSLTD